MIYVSWKRLFCTISLKPPTKQSLLSAIPYELSFLIHYNGIRAMSLKVIWETWPRTLSVQLQNTPIWRGLFFWGNKDTRTWWKHWCKSWYQIELVKVWIESHSCWRISRGSPSCLLNTRARVERNLLERRPSSLTQPREDIRARWLHYGFFKTHTCRCCFKQWLAYWRQEACCTHYCFTKADHRSFSKLWTKPVKCSHCFLLFYNFQCIEWDLSQVVSNTLPYISSSSPDMQLPLTWSLWLGNFHYPSTSFPFESFD